MRSELFRIPFELGGVPIFGFGVLLVVWLVGASLLLLRERRRAAKTGHPLPVSDQTISLLIALAGGAAIVLLPRFFEGGLPIRGYGVMLLLAATTGLAMAVHRAKQHGLHPDVIYSLTFWMFVFGIAGARLFFVIEYWGDDVFKGETLLERLGKAMTFTEGGLVVYGSLIGAAGVFVWRCRKQELPVLAVADILAPSLAVGLAIGRLGCLMNGCCYGGLCDRPWAVTFPRYHSPYSLEYSPPYGDQVIRGEMHGVRLAEDESADPPRVLVAAVRAGVEGGGGLSIGDRVVGVNGRRAASLEEARPQLTTAYNEGRPVVLNLAGGAAVTLPAAPIRDRSLPVHPTQLYSAINAGLLGWFLWSCYPLRRRDGEGIGLLLSIYPVSRFLLEIIRTDESAFFRTGLSISQNVSLLILLAMGGYWFWLCRRPRGLAYAVSQTS